VTGFDPLGDMSFAPMGALSFLHSQLPQATPLPKQSQPLLGGQQPQPQPGASLWTNPDTGQTVYAGGNPQQPQGLLARLGQAFGSQGGQGGQGLLQSLLMMAGG
jgi:hypothetical protein